MDNHPTLTSMEMEATGSDTGISTMATLSTKEDKSSKLMVQTKLQVLATLVLLKRIKARHVINSLRSSTSITSQTI